jgi:hypothetical protein
LSYSQTNLFILDIICGKLLVHLQWKSYLINLESEGKETIIDQNEGVEHIFKFNHAKEF